MPKLVPGLYDLPLTRELRQALDQLEAKRFAAKTGSPDPADAHELLGRHVATLVRQILAIGTAAPADGSLDVLNAF